MRIERVYAQNSEAWALGAKRHHGFYVRRVVWGLMMAVAERRSGEEIRKCSIMVEKDPKRRTLPKLFEVDRGNFTQPAD